MRFLVLGGTRFVGRAVEDARHADRTRTEALAAALGDDAWNAVVDTWAGAPQVAGRPVEQTAASTGCRPTSRRGCSQADPLVGAPCRRRRTRTDCGRTTIFLGGEA